MAIPGMRVLKGYCSYGGSFILQPQYIACSVAGVITCRDEHTPLGRPPRLIWQLVSLSSDTMESARISNTKKSMFYEIPTEKYIL